MNAPVVTDSMREWAAAFVNAARIGARAVGQPFDQAKTERTIREALLNPRPQPDLDPVTDDHSGPVDHATADRAAASNYPQGVLR